MLSSLDAGRYAALVRYKSAGLAAVAPRSRHARKALGGLTFRIDRPKGHVKEWPGGRKWTYPVDYGYVPKVKGEDGESLDAFVGDDPDGCLESFTKLKSDPKDASRKIVDETKFLLGLTPDEKKKVYAFYGDEVGDKQTYKDWDAVTAAIGSFKGKHRRAVEDAAAVVHAQWAEHAKSLLKSEDISKDRAKRWRQLIKTPYHRLAESEKQSDRVWARRYVAAQFGKAADLTPTSDNARSLGGVKVLGTRNPAPAKPPPQPAAPTPLPVPSSSTPQVLKMSSDMLVAPSTFGEPVPQDLTHAHAAEGAQVQDLIDRFFRDQVDTHANVVPTGSESAAGQVVAPDTNGVA